MPRAITRRALVGCLPSVAFAASAPVSTIDTDLSYPEGLLVHDGKLYVADILREQIIVYNGSRRERVIALNSCGPTSISPFLTDQILVTCHMAGRLTVLTKDGDVKGNI